MNRPPAARNAVLLLAVSWLPLLCGCDIFGVAAQALPPPSVQPVYGGLRDQSVGVMVWADRGLRIDFPPLQIDIANAVQTRLQKSKEREVRGTTWPVKPTSIVKFQQDYPEVEAEAITDIAPKLGVSRLIYIEVEDFTTRSHGSLELFRGSAEVTLRVVEVNNGVAKVAYEENGITVTYPEKVPPEGIPGASDRKIYVGTIDALGTALSRKFVPYVPER